MAEPMQAARMEFKRAEQGEVDPEYRELVTQAAKDNQKLSARIGLPHNMLECDDPFVVCGDKIVDIIVPKRFVLTEDNTRNQVVFSPGIRAVAQRHADHWWVKAHGCTIARRREAPAPAAAKLPADRQGTTDIT